MSHSYLECIGDQELERLQAQHEAWWPAMTRGLQQAGVFNSERIVEFGCGPGLIALELHRQNPGAVICGLDISDFYLNHLRAEVASKDLRGISVLQQSATDPVPFAGEFDAAICRWFLAWVTKDIDAVLANIHKSLRPGGRFVCMEYLTLRSVAHSPALPELPAYLRAWEDFYRDAGGTTQIGESIVAHLRHAGFEIEEMYCLGGLSRAGQPLFNWWKRLFHEFGEKFVQKGLLAHEAWQNIAAYWARTDGDPNAFVHTPLILQVVATR